MTGVTRTTTTTSVIPLPGAAIRAPRRRFSLMKLGLPAVGFSVFAFLYLPIFVLVIFSFNSGTHMGAWEGFSAKWYESVFQNRQLMTSLEVTVWVAFTSMVLSTILGTMAALALERFKFPGKLTFDGIMYLPVIIPDIVMALSLLLFFSSMGVVLSRYTILIGHVAFNTAFVAVIVRARLAVMNSKLEEAAADLYANPWQSFRYVTFPLLKPGILAGALMAFTMSFDEFVITSFTSGVGDTTLSVRIWSMLRFGLKPEVPAIAVLILFASTLLVVASLVTQGAARKSA